MQNNPTAFALVAHPDDVEFMMAGTMVLLRRRGWSLHYMTVANGSCGTTVMDRDAIVAARTAEAAEAAAMLGATYHPPLVDDLMIYYEPSLVARLCAVVRQVRPGVLLLPHPLDYMEDHVNTSRLGVTAAFCRNMRNFITDPPTQPTLDELAVYHAMPMGLADQLRRPVRADFYVDIETAMEEKLTALACHRSQKEWLDASQGYNSYVLTARSRAEKVGQQSGRFDYADGWFRHLHHGFAGSADFDPLREALGDCVCGGD